MIRAEPIPQRPRKGRPRIEDRNNTIEATKPWLALKMSRSTWYRRKKEELASLPYEDDIAREALAPIRQFMDRKK